MLNKKIPKGFGIFLKRLVRTSELPTALWFWISKMPSKLRQNTMPSGEAARQHLPKSVNLQIGGEGGSRTHKSLRTPVFKTGGIAIIRPLQILIYVLDC